jgi:inosose dehydratase
MTLQIASAPVSWGITESIAFPPEYPYSRVLDEIAEAGYAATELGPYGFLPTDPMALRQELEQRNLTLCSAFVAFPLVKIAAHRDGFAHVERTAVLIGQVSCRLLILSDEVCAERSATAGRPDEATRLSWSDSEWQIAEPAIRRVIQQCASHGMRVAFHHHVGTHVETPKEIDRLLTLFSGDELGLCLDTGHCVYGGGDPIDLLERYGERILCVHLKDISASRLSSARSKGLDFHAGVRHGVFAPLGEGSIDFTRVLDALRDLQFQGWAVVEQDVLAGGQGADTPLANVTAARRFLLQLGY